ncbi:MAG: vitamin K epoxide reductase family protein [Rhodococcus sp.]|nr:vitamin K epoxide reductase family protein [Rhodococcus sp. (in: high G+C Gram-positive bacteria)]
MSDSPAHADPDSSVEVPAAASGGVAFSRVLPWLLFVGGLIGFIASFVLTVEKLELLKDGSYVPSCSIDAVMDCGAVMVTSQAAVFGFPNSLIGLAGFAIVTTTGAGLLARARFARWYWLGLQIGLTAAVVFVHWLILQSLFVIESLCPYCMVVWAVTVPMFWYVTLRNLNQGVFSPRVPTQVVSAAGNHLLPILVWFFTIGGLVVYLFYI